MGVVIVEGEWVILGVNLGRPIVTNGPLRRGSSQITMRTRFEFVASLIHHT